MSRDLAIVHIGTLGAKFQKFMRNSNNSTFSPPTPSNPPRRRLYLIWALCGSIRTIPQVTAPHNALWVSRRRVLVRPTGFGLLTPSPCDMARARHRWPREHPRRPPKPDHRVPAMQGGL